MPLIAGIYIGICYITQEALPMVLFYAMICHLFYQPENKNLPLSPPAMQSSTTRVLSTPESQWLRFHMGLFPPTLEWRGAFFIFWLEPVRSSE